ncbi:hypothetical protein ACFL1X_13430, partial [Candidatus Hydrogenedentota bacterium]
MRGNTKRSERQGPFLEGVAELSVRNLAFIRNFAWTIAAAVPLIFATGSSCVSSEPVLTGVPSEVTDPDQTEFSGERAYAHVEHLVTNIGVRAPGTVGMALTRAYIKQHLDDAGLAILSDPYTATTPV